MLGVIRSEQFLVDICQCLLEQLVIFTEQIKVRAVRHHLASNLASEEEVLTEGCLEAACGVEACASYVCALRDERRDHTSTRPSIRQNSGPRATAPCTAPKGHALVMLE